MGWLKALFGRDEENKLQQAMAENKRAESRLWLATARRSDDEEAKREAARRARESAREAREMEYITDAADAFEGRQ